MINVLCVCVVEQQLTLSRFFLTVKFDTEKLPAILNALETQNNGQKLVLEVAVCFLYPPPPVTSDGEEISTFDARLNNHR